MENAACPIHITAANGDNPGGEAAKCFHELFCLFPIAQNEIDNGVRSKRTESLDVRPQIIPVADDLSHWNGRPGDTPVKDTDLMPQPGKLARHMAADESRGANEEDSHIGVSRPHYSNSGLTKSGPETASISDPRSEP
jgi:hypothetical protein